MNLRPLSLRQLQEWFTGAMMHPGAMVEGAHEVARLLTPGPLLSSVDRLGIYQDAYTSRLVECLADDYPALHSALGDGAFETLCCKYIAIHPSRSPSLNRFGMHMSDFAIAHGGEHAAFLSDLAGLEWAVVETIHAPDADVMGLDALQTIAPERWAGARLPASSTARLLRFDYPVNRFYQAFRNGEAPAIPAAEESATAIYRKGYVVWRMDLTPPMRSLLEALFAGATLEQALTKMPLTATLRESNVTVWFREWVAAGLFARADLDADDE